MKNNFPTHPGVVIHGPWRGGPVVTRWWRRFDWRVLASMAFGGFWGFLFGLLF